MNPYHKLFDDRAHIGHAEHLAELAAGMAVVGESVRRKRRREQANDMTPQEQAKALAAHRVLRRQLQAELATEARKATK